MYRLETEHAQAFPRTQPQPPKDNTDQRSPLRLVMMSTIGDAGKDMLKEADSPLSVLVTQDTGVEERAQTRSNVFAQSMDCRAGQKLVGSTSRCERVSILIGPGSTGAAARSSRATSRAKEGALTLARAARSGR